MQVFYVSLRTALIYGPGEILDARSAGEERMYLRMTWPHAYSFDEWEGYAIVVPERNEVWGMCHPRLELGELTTEFDFTPREIPEGERKLFDPEAQAELAAAAKAGPRGPKTPRKRIPKPASKPVAKPAAPDSEDWGQAFQIDD